MVLQSLMVETLYKAQAAAQRGEHQPKKAITQFKAEFAKTVKACLSSSSQPTSLLEKIELGKGHFVAYRYQFICFHHQHGGTGSNVSFMTARRTRLGDHERFYLMIEMNEEAPMEEIKKYIDEERRLRASHLVPALSIFNAANFDELKRDTKLLSMQVSAIQEAFEHIQEMNKQFAAILKKCNEKKSKIAAYQAKNISEYCAELAALQTEWGIAFSRHAALVQQFCFDRIPEVIATHPVTEQVMGGLREWQRSVEGPAEKVASTVISAVEKQKAEFESLQKKADAVRTEMMLLANAQQERYARIREKRAAAQKVAQESSLVMPHKVEDTKEEETASVLVLAKVKSDPLIRLEYLDKKLSEFVGRLWTSALKIKKVLHTGDVEFLDKQLHASSTDFASLVEMRDRFVKLSQSLPSDEKAELNEGIDMSIENAGRLEKQAFELLQDAADELKNSFDDSRAGRKEKIEKLGKEIAGDEVDKLSAQEIFALGWPEWIRRGQANRRNGNGLSEFSLKRKYLRACYETYYPKMLSILQNRPVENNVADSSCVVNYPEHIQAAWLRVKGVPGNQFLFGEMLIDFLRSPKATSKRLVLPVYHFSSQCETAGEVFEAQNSFQTSIFSSKQCYLTTSRAEIINLFLMGQMKKEDNTSPLFFTVDFVMGDEEGYIFDLAGSGLQDIKAGILKTYSPAALILKEKPAAALYALLKMAKGFKADDELTRALLDWKPSVQMNMPYLKTVASEHLRQLFPEEKLQYVNLCGQYDLFKKMFGVDYSALAEEDALQKLEALVTPKVPPGRSPALFVPSSALLPSPITIADNIKRPSKE